MEKIPGFLKDFWGPLAAIVTAIVYALVQPLLPDINTNALAALLALAILAVWVVGKYWHVDIKVKIIVIVAILALVSGLGYYYFWSSLPHFEIKAFNTLEGDPDGYEITEMLIWNADSFDDYNVEVKFEFQVTPRYNGQRKFGQVVALIYGNEKNPPLEKPLWSSFTKDSDPLSVSLVLREVLDLKKRTSSLYPPSRRLPPALAWRAR